MGDTNDLSPRIRVSDDAMINMRLADDVEALEEQRKELVRAYPHRDHYGYVVSELRRTARRIVWDCCLDFSCNRTQLEAAVREMQHAERLIQPDVADDSALAASYTRDIAQWREQIAEALRPKTKA